MPLFPACAGVIPTFVTLFGKNLSFPRMRGGDPWVGLGVKLDIAFSPHARG